MTTACPSSEVAVFSSFWDSLPSINEEDGAFLFAKTGHLQQSSLNYESLSRVLGIIEHAEDIVQSSSGLFDDADLEPLPIGGNATFTQKLGETLSLPTSRPTEEQGRDEILDDFIGTIKRHSDDESAPAAKKQRLSGPTCVVSFSTDEDSEEEARNQTTTKKNGQSARFRRYQADQWMERFEDLVDFREEFGSCLVPHSYPPNQQLAQWVKRQRYQHKLKKEGRHSTLTDARQKELEDMGFVWDSHMDALKVYQKRHGNCLVPTNYDEDRPLAVWVKCQRRQLKLFRKGQRTTMTKDRFQELEKLGFQWNPRNL